MGRGGGCRHAHGTARGGGWGVQVELGDWDGMEVGYRVWLNGGCMGWGWSGEMVNARVRDGDGMRVGVELTGGTPWRWGMEWRMGVHDGVG